MSTSYKVTGGAAVVALILAVAAVLFVGAWATMVGLGILHAELSPAIPAVGYWSAFLVNIGLALVIRRPSVASNYAAK